MEDSGLVLPALLVEENLRPFLSLGLHYVYSETDYGFVGRAPFSELKKPLQNATSAKRRTEPATIIEDRPNRTDIPKCQKPSAVKEQIDAKKNQSPSAVQTPRQFVRLETAYETNSSAPSLNSPDKNRPPHSNGRNPEETWPTPWKNHWKNIGRCRPVVWTYWELGLDMGGRADARRGDLLRKFNTELGLPPGTNAYWPITALDEKNTLQTNRSVFLAGLERIAPSFAIVCGEKALEAIFPGTSLSPFSRHFLHNCLMLTLPEIMDLLKDETLQNRTLAFLRPCLSALKA